MRHKRHFETAMQRHSAEIKRGYSGLALPQPRHCTQKIACLMKTIVNHKIPYNPPSPVGRGLEGGGNSPSPNLPLRGRGIFSRYYAEDYKNSCNVHLVTSPRRVTLARRPLPRGEAVSFSADSQCIKHVLKWR